MPVDRSGLINLGTISKAARHGALIDRFKATFLEIPSNQRKENMLVRLEVSEIIDMMGLTDILQKAFISNMSLLDRDEAAAIARIRRMIGVELAGDTGLIAQMDTSPAPVEVNIPDMDDSDDDQVVDVDTGVASADITEALVELETQATDQPGDPEIETVKKPESSFALAGLMKMVG